MNNASPRRFSSSFPAGGGLAPMNVLDAVIEDDDWSQRGGAAVSATPGESALHGPSRSPGSFTSPFSAENPAGDDVAGFFIGLVIALGAGLAVWACFIAALIFFSK